MLGSTGGTCMATTITTFSDNVTAIPTTGANFLLYNNEPQNGKTYVLDSACITTKVVDATQTNSHVIMAVLQTAANMVANGAVTDIRNKKFKGNCAPYTGNALVFSGTTAGSLTTTVVNTGWFNLGASAPSGQAAAGALWIAQEARIDGKICLTPGTAIGLAAVSLATVTASIAYTITWYEVQLPIFS